ncbi:MAG: hypothetical protein WCO55_01525 [Candidatus Falkowbacteria bacterium]
MRPKNSDIISNFTYVSVNGDPGIYLSPLVTKPDNNQEERELPIHEDERGRIVRANFKGGKFNIIETKKGFMRSGDLHKSTQFDWLISGKAELWTLSNNITKVITIKPTTFIVIKPHVPHLFNFLEDSVMIEKWDKPFDAWFYKPYRELIDRQCQKRVAELDGGHCLE